MLIKGSLNTSAPNEKKLKARQVYLDAARWPDGKGFSVAAAGPPVDLSGLYHGLDRANQALGRLDGLTTLLPDTRLAFPSRGLEDSAQ